MSSIRRRAQRAAEKSRSWLTESQAELLQHGAVCCLIQDQVINGGIWENSLRRAALMVIFWNIQREWQEQKKKPKFCLVRFREKVNLIGSLQ